jgi:hypothetical protein
VISVHEVCRNLVVKFDPQILLDLEAHPSTSARFSVQGLHYFLCLERCGPYSVWVPAYSRASNGRIRLKWKGGLPSWVDPESFVDATQIWMIPDAALGPASLADPTTRGCRNFASTFFLFPANEMAATG